MDDTPLGLSGNETTSHQGVRIVYDGDCPFCSAYVRMVRLRNAAGSVVLLDARHHPDVGRELRDLGYDLNEGMMLIIDNQYYHGADCINRIALMSTSSGFFNRVNAILFRSPLISKVVYPFLRFGRNAVLRILGRKPIDLDAI